MLFPIDKCDSQIISQAIDGHLNSIIDSFLFFSQYHRYIEIAQSCCDNKEQDNCSHLYNFMIKIREIFLSRVADIQQLFKMQSNDQITIEEQLRSSIVKKTSKKYVAIDKRETQRLRLQLQAMYEMESYSMKSQQTLREFIGFIIQIFSSFDSALEENYQQMRQKELPATILNKMYRYFMGKHAQSGQFKHINCLLKKQLHQLSPLVYVGLFGEWSRRTLNDLIKNKRMPNPEPIRLNIELVRLLRKKMQQQQTRQSSGNLFLHCKQNYYGYFLSQMQQYYKRYDLLDLDMQYLKTIKKIGRKQDILTTNNFSLASKFIISKQNNRVEAEIIKYINAYDHYVQKLSKKRLRSLNIQTSPIKARSNHKIFKSIKSLTKKETQVIRPILKRSIQTEKNQQNQNRQRRNFKQIKHSSKVLFQQHYHRIEFPLISQQLGICPQQNSNHNSNKQTTKFANKKSLKKITQTQPEQRVHLRFLTRNQTSQQKRKKKKNSPISIILMDDNQQYQPFFNPEMRLYTNVEVKLDEPSLQTQFQRRRVSMIKKFKQKDIDISKKSDKIHIKTTFCFDDSIMKKNIKLAERQQLFQSDKGQR